MVSRRQAIAGAMASPVLFSGFSALGQPSPPTVEEFLRPALDRDMALSPDGKRIAILTVKVVGEKNGEKQTAATVTLLDADAPDTGRTLVQLGPMNAYRLAWGSDSRLLIWIRSDAIEASGRKSTKKESPSVRRIIAVDPDGKRPKVLFNDDSDRIRNIYDLARVVDLLRDDPNYVLMQAWHPDFGTWALYRVNINTGLPVLMERGEQKTWGWAFQNGVPVVRYDGNYRGTVMSIYTRPPGAKAWTFYRKVRAGDWAKQQFEIVGPTREPGVMLATTLVEGSDTTALRKFDLSTMSLGDLVAAPPGRDVEAAIYTPSGDLVGASYTDDRRNYQFVDPAFGPHFRALNKFLGNESNIDFFDISADGQRFLALVSGPRDAGSYYFYDRKAKRFDALGQKKPWLTADRLAKVEVLSVKTRDGATIAAYLTVPLAQGPRPLVVMPHGGPEVRDSVKHDAFAQVLAAQGWMVLQPNFRGSGGYGEAFAKSGRKRWGDRMQEDVEDAVSLMAASGRIDSGKVAICGYSYGGYAALMGAARRPDLYKAVVAMAGDSDLHEAIAFAKAEEGADSPAYLYWLDTIGDPATDGEAMRAASPALMASRFAAPVLLISGTEDNVVSPKQSRIMAQALRAACKTVEHIEMKGVGHRDLEEEHWRLLYTRTIDHIAKAFSA